MNYITKIIAGILIVLAFHVQAQTGSIFAVVSGDTVTLWQTGAERNCGAAYRMEVEWNDHEVTWYQWDTGAPALCLCYFDLSVKFQVGEPGEYTVQVYYSESINPGELIYQGSTFFVIGPAAKRDGIISSYQSDCYSNIGIGDSRQTNDPSFRFYPNPLTDGRIVHFEVDGVLENVRLEIYSITGRKIFSKEYDPNQRIADQWVTDGLFPCRGLYLIKLMTGRNIQSRLISVL